MDLSKKQALDADPKAIQQIIFSMKSSKRRKLKYNYDFHYWRSKRNCFRFFTRNYKSILILLFVLIYNDSIKPFNAKLSNSQLNKLKWGIKNDTEVTLKISWNVAGDSNDEKNFPRKLF